MSELYPVQDSNPFESIAIEAASSHWREYYGQPENSRLGDEHAWDSVVVEAIAQIGIEVATARELNECAKLDAQFPY